MADTLKPRSKVVLEATITEMLHNEYQRYLSVDDLLVTIDSQQYLGTVTKEEAEQVVNSLKRIEELKANEITVLSTLNKVIFNMVRPAKEEEADKEADKDADKEMAVENITSVEDLKTESAMRGFEKDKKEE